MTAPERAPPRRSRRALSSASAPRSMGHPHLAGSTTASAPASSAADVVVRNSKRPSASESASLPLPLVNDVTGLNHMPSACSAAKASEDMRTRVLDSIKLRAKPASVSPGKLYFIALEKFKGELRISIGPASKDATFSGSDADTRAVHW
eukprot:6208917-Pleurochrysis_carterae.AAC.2